LEGVAIMNASHPRYPEVFEVYRYDTAAQANDLGEMPAPDPTDPTNLIMVGEMRGRVNLGDSLEPDVRGSIKNYGQDVTSMWIGIFDYTDSLELKTGDMIINKIDSTRKFFVQFIDVRPGGTEHHHWECRLQTSETMRT
jgi:hypothetical protein